MKKTRYDERNLIFSRVNLEKDSKDYQEYYKKYPDLKAYDDKIRGLDFEYRLRKSDAFKQLFFPLFETSAPLIKSYHEMVNNTLVSAKQTVPKDFHENIKAITKHYGAKDVGIVKLSDDHYYTHKGNLNRHINKNNYGEEIKPVYTHAIVYLVPMDKDMINRAPYVEEMLETYNQYTNVATIGARLAMYLKAIGYDSTFSSIDHYLTPLVPLAYDAGLGEIGMANHIVHPKYGDRIRLGAVLTTLELVADKPIDFGLESFCKRCSLCLMNCPSGSISHKKRIVNGRVFYEFNDQSCFELFKNTGTDCGVCIQSCPFTQGIESHVVDWMKNDTTRIDQVIQSHMKIHSRRKVNRTPSAITKGEL